MKNNILPVDEEAKEKEGEEQKNNNKNRKKQWTVILQASWLLCYTDSLFSSQNPS